MGLEEAEKRRPVRLPSKGKARMEETCAENALVLVLFPVTCAVALESGVHLVVKEQRIRMNSPNVPNVMAEVFGCAVYVLELVCAT